MKRTLLVAIPLLALALGALFLLSRNASAPPGTPPAETDPDRTGPAVPDPDPGGAESPDPAPDLPSSTGSLRVLVRVDGRGLPDVRTTLRLESERQPRVAKTGSRGRARFDALEPGVYAVTARHRAYVPATARYEIAAGRTGELSIDLRRGGRLVGTVTGTDARPVAGARATLLKPETREFLHPDLAATSSLDGTFVIDGIPEPRFGLIVNHPGTRPWTRTDLALSHPVDEIRVTVRLDAGTRIAGRVIDRAGLPVAGADVVATNESAVLGKTDAQGAFEIGGLGRKPVNLAVKAEGYGAAYLRGIAPGTEGLEIRLENGATLRGRVTAEPAPIAFAVILVRWDAEREREQRIQSKTYINDHEGAFTLPDIAPGTYWVEVESEGYRAETRPQVTLQPGQILEGLVFRLAVK